MKKIRFFDENGSAVPTYGYISEGKFIFTDIDFSISLAFDVKTAHSIQTGGMCMLDIIKFEDGNLLALNEEFYGIFESDNALLRSFSSHPEQEALIFEDIIASEYMPKQAIYHEIAYQEWAKECIKRNITITDINFMYNGIYISEPNFDETMRFTVNPVDYYSDNYLKSIRYKIDLRLKDMK